MNVFLKNHKTLIILSFILGFACGWTFDIIPARFESLALPSPDLLITHIISALCFGIIVTSVILSVIYEKELFHISLWQILIIFVLINITSLVYIKTSRTVYFWDNAGYWLTARNLSSSHIGRTLIRQVLISTISEDYNDLLALPVAVVMKLFGGSRAVFILSISNLYTLPACLGLCAMCPKNNAGGIILTCCFPMIIYMGIVGFVDVAACACAVWAIVFYCSGRHAWSSGILSGMCLCLSFLLRRYFFFYAAAFCLAAFLSWILIDRKKYLHFFAFLLSFIIADCFFAFNFIYEKVVVSNFADLYSAYKLGLTYDIMLTCRYFGFLLILFIAVLAVKSVAKKESVYEIGFALILTVSCYTAFVHVQTHGQQHLLMYVPALAMIISKIEFVNPVVTSVISAVIFLNCFIPKTQPGSIQEIKYPSPVPSFIFYGPKREDIDSLLSLLEYLNSISENGSKTAVILSSSLTFNSETLTNLLPSLNIAEPDNQIQFISQGTVDRVNSLNWNIFNADYIVLGDPLQTHLGEENQEIIAFLVNDLLNGENMADAYLLRPDFFSLSNDVTVRIFERKRDLSHEELKFISDRLLSLYPDYEDKYGLPSD